MIVNDAHCHFFSTPFVASLARGLTDVEPSRAVETALARLGWDDPGAADALADRWAAELDRHGVSRAALIASVPGDSASVATAVRRHPRRFVGFLMIDPTAADAPAEATRAIEHDGVRAICLFPSMQRYFVQDARVRAIFDVAASHPGTAVFVHCGVLTVGARKKLGLPSPFDVRFGNPLDLHAVAAAYPAVPIVVPHFGAGMFREALMLADLCPNVLLDTSSSNGWIKYQPGLTLAAVFERAIRVVGPDRLLFGTDSSFFPRGWVHDVYGQQRAILQELQAGDAVAQQIFGGNFDRVFAA